MAGDCEALAAYAVFDFAEVVDVDFGWLFAGVFGTFNLDDGSWSCPWSSEEFNLFFAVFCVVAGEEHSAAFYALHLSWSEVSSDDYVLTEKLIFCEVWAETALNNSFCAFRKYGRSPAAGFAVCGVAMLRVPLSLQPPHSLISFVRLRWPPSAPFTALTLCFSKMYPRKHTFLRVYQHSLLHFLRLNQVYLPLVRKYILDL